MARKFSELRKRMTAKSQDRARVKAQALFTDLMLADVRKALDLSQEELAGLMDLKQPAVSKLEKSTDMYLSTLRRYIEAMGGHLEIKARFDDGEVTINQFEDLGTRV